MMPSGQNLGHSTIAGAHASLGALWATATHIPGQGPEDAHRKYEPSQVSPHFCFQCKLLLQVLDSKQLLEKVPVQVITADT